MSALDRDQIATKVAASRRKDNLLESGLTVASGDEFLEIAWMLDKLIQKAGAVCKFPADG